MELLKKIQKKDEVKLLKCDAVKRFIRENEHYLKRYNIDLVIKKDEDFFYFECLVQTLKNKEQFEGCFVKSYDDMIDYWQTLTYEERKRLINIDIEKVKEEMPFTVRNNQRLYLPCMNERINAIYENEMVLFELKQYNRLRFDCKDMIDQYSLTCEMVSFHFTSLQLVQLDVNGYWAYCPLSSTLYHFIDDRIAESFPFVRFQREMNELEEWLLLYQQEDEEACLKMLIEKGWISEKMTKKMTKVLERRKK